MRIALSANAFALLLYQKTGKFNHFFMTKQMKQALCVRLLSMIVTVNLVAVLGGTAL